MTATKIAFLAFLLGGAALTACGPAAEQPAPTHLTDVDIPDGFDFATTRAVTADFEALDLTVGQRVRIMLPSGATVFDGPATARPTAVIVPTAYETVTVEHSGQGRRVRSIARIEEGRLVFDR